MIADARIGVLGGTLDPIHLGHVDAAAAARDALALDRILIVPSHVPPHRPQPIASAYHRFAMASLAVNGIDGWLVSDEELRSPGPSYTADTLDRLHETGLAPGQIFFITGADAFAEIETWSRYPQVLDMAQFAVVSRPGASALVLPQKLAALASRMTTVGQGRERRAETSIWLVDASTRDISSTDIRRRLSYGEPVSGLVPGSVEAHILQHGLYAGAHRDEGVQRTADHLHGQN